MTRPQSIKRTGKTFWRALTLDADVYAEAFQRSTSNRTAYILVGIAALSHAIGSSMILLTYNSAPALHVLAFLINGLSIVAGYYGWTWTIWSLTGGLRSKRPSYARFLPPVGLTYAPQVFNVFTVVPLLGRPIELALALWSLVAAIIALHHGLNRKLGKAIAICTGGWIGVQIAIGIIQIGVQRFLE
ncbi:MAG: hypothetical protein IGS50_14940 [Synechococcales cyanobacterium C42_A2020_086]|jgi:hypothetical protein|nr:hypothetical protein [Synechococcales cyanobacterium C42_A2020_086]